MFNRKPRQFFFFDLSLISRSFIAVIGNAVKYCTSGTIEVAVRSTRAEAVMSVRDTGVGYV